MINGNKAKELTAPAERTTLLRSAPHFPRRLGFRIALILLAVCALQSAWLAAGVNEWTSSGPGKTVVLGMCPDPSRPGRMIVLTPLQYDYKAAMMTTDAGNTWSELGLPIHLVPRVASIVFDAQDEKRIFA